MNIKLHIFAACIFCCRLESTCNHVAAVLFKLDYAWQNGYTSKASISFQPSGLHHQNVDVGLSRRNLVK